MHPLLPGCNNTCQKKCIDNFQEADRFIINKQFWSLSFTERRQWFDSNITEKSVKQHTASNKENMRKSSLKYKLPSQQGVKIDVCKTMFLRTLGLKTDGMVTQLLKAKRRSYEDNIAPINDRRGKHEVYENHKADYEAIRYHINSYKPSISHYTRVNAPNRRYLNPELTVTDMLADYNSSSSKKVSYSAYILFLKVRISDSAGHQ